MERRTFLKLTGATALASALARPALAAPTTVRWWYHFDDPKASPAGLVAKFEAANPDRRDLHDNLIRAVLPGEPSGAVPWTATPLRGLQ